MSDYSKTPLYKKLGVKDGMTMLIIHETDDYDSLIGPILKTVHKNTSLEKEKVYDFIHLFTRSQEELHELFPKLKESLTYKGMLWISWPKGSCGVGITNLNDNIVRDIGLENGLVDVKIASIDDTWSGIKFVYRLKDRK